MNALPVLPVRLWLALIAFMTLNAGAQVNIPAVRLPQSGPSLQAPAAVVTTVTNESSKAALNVQLFLPPPKGGPVPTLILVPGGSGDSRMFAPPSRVAGELAAGGYGVVVFDPDGRGKSTGKEDYDGYLQQDGLASIVQWTQVQPQIDSNRVAIVSYSYGITMAAGALARHPDLPVRFLIDWEGPADRRDTAGCDGSNVGHLRNVARCDDETFWQEHEAVRFISKIKVPYQRIQSYRDHAQPDHVHTLAMLNAAFTGGVPEVWLNDYRMQGLFKSAAQLRLLPDSEDRVREQHVLKYANNFYSRLGANNNNRLPPGTMATGNYIIPEPGSDLTPRRGRGIAPRTAGGTGPWATRLMLATAGNGLDFVRTEKILSDQTGVPNLMTDKEGRARAYYIDYGNGNIIACAIRTGTNRWQYRRVRHNFTGSRQQPVDPTVVLLPDGRYRLYVMWANNTPEIYSAISNDGINFTAEQGVRFSAAPDSVFDPMVLHIGNVWHLWTGPNGLYHSLSPDGLVFLPANSFRIQGRRFMPWSAIELNGGGYRLYGHYPDRNGPAGIASLYSRDGNDWVMEQGTRLSDRGADPRWERGVLPDNGCTQLPDGSFLMGYLTVIP